MEDNKKQTVNEGWLPWIVFAVITALPFLAWGANLGWEFTGFSSLSLFPLLGLLAWSTMWTHYVLGSVRLMNGKTKNIVYSKFSGFFVLFLILLHPALLVYGMRKVTGLLPPESYAAYVGDGLVWAVLLGTISLIIFLSFEVFERLRHKAVIKKAWFFISLSQMLAMVLIFVHSLSIGQNLQSGWFLYYWLLMGALLVPCFAVIGREDWNKFKKDRASIN